MQTVFRVDRVALRKPRRTPQGFLEVDGFIARPGIYEYPQPDGTVLREFKPPEVAFDEAAMAAYDAISVTNGHPRVDGKLTPVTAENVRSYEVGTVRGAARRDGDRLVATIVIKDAKAIRDVDAGRRELSPGYAAEVDEVPGADKRWGYPGNLEGRWDSIQVRVVPNHLALVDYARGGTGMRLRLDGAARVDGAGKLTTETDGHQHLVDFLDWNGAPQSSGSTSWAVSAGAENSHEHPWTRSPDGRITIGASEGHTHEILDENPLYGARADHAAGAQIDRSAAGHDSGRMADDPNPPADAADKLRLQTVRADEAERLAAQRQDALTTATREADGLRADLATARERIKTLEVQIAAGASVVETAAVAEAKQRADAAERELAETRKQQPAIVRKRASLISRAQAVIGPDFRADGLTEREIAVAGIKRLRPREDTSSNVSDDYLLRRFDALVEDSMAHDASLARASRVLTINRADEGAPKQAPRPWADQWKDGAGQFATNRAKEA